MNKIKKILLLVFLIQVGLFANEVEEVSLYTQYKYKVNYNELTKDEQSKVTDEYKQLQTLTKKVEEDVKDSIIYKVKKNIVTFEAWSNDFMMKYQPTEQELKFIYDNIALKTNPEYKLKTIVVKDKNRAESILRQLKNRKTLQDRTKLFNYFVKKDSIDEQTKSKKGDIGWMQQGSFIPTIQKKLATLKVNDLLKLNVKENVQILYLVDKVEPRKATFEEAKQTLIQLAKQEALSKKLTDLVK